MFIIRRKANAIVIKTWARPLCSSRLIILWTDLIIQDNIYFIIILIKLLTPTRLTWWLTRVTCWSAGAISFLRYPINYASHVIWAAISKAFLWALNLTLLLKSNIIEIIWLFKILSFHGWGLGNQSRDLRVFSAI